MQIESEIKSDITGETHTLITQASALQIVTHDDYNTATLLNKTAKQVKSAIEEYFKPMKDRAYASHREICKKEKDQLEPIESVLRKLSSEMNAYDRKIEAEARKAKADEEARLRKIQDEQRLKQAVALEEAGKKELAEKVLNTVAPVNVQIEKPDLKLNGTKSRTNWKFRIVDASLVPDEYRVPCERQIGARVKSTDGQCVIPGVEIFSEKSFY